MQDPSSPSVLSQGLSHLILSPGALLSPAQVSSHASSPLPALKVKGK